MQQSLDRTLTFKLFALELLVIELLATIHLLRPDPLADAKAHRANLRKRLLETQLPLDETVSDYVTSGLSDLADKILEAVQDEVERRVSSGHEHTS
jgi:hypothetical protein